MGVVRKSTRVYLQGISDDELEALFDAAVVLIIDLRYWCGWADYADGDDEDQISSAADVEARAGAFLDLVLPTNDAESS